MEAASILSRILLSLLFLVSIILPISSATCPSTTDKLPLSLHERQAQKLIRGLNLCPKQSTNIVLTQSLLVPHDNKVVEKQFIFPKLIAPDGPSVQDLGHYAGYYSLPNSKDARSQFFFNLLFVSLLMILL